MSYTIESLKDKIFEIHPEIVQHALNLRASFDTAQNAYVLTFSRCGKELKTFINKEDADECMEGKKCIHLGGQIAEFLADFEAIAGTKKSS